MLGAIDVTVIFLNNSSIYVNDKHRDIIIQVLNIDKILKVSYWATLFQSQCVIIQIEPETEIESRVAQTQLWQKQKTKKTSK